MKKVIKCLGMMALVALAFTSCKKVEQQTTFKARMPQLIIEDEDRAYIDESSMVHFEIGDRVMIFNISEIDPEMSHCATYKAIEDGTYVEFVNSGMGTVGVALDGGYYAYYPSTLVSDGDDGFSGFVSDRVDTELEYGQNKSKFFISPVQQYREDKVARKDLYLAGHTTQADAPNLAVADFTMNFICGVWQLKPYEAAQRTVTKIEVIDEYFHLSGWVEVIIPECNPTEMTDLFNRFDPTNPTYVNELNAFRTRTGYNVTGKNPGDVGKSITLNMPEGGVKLGKTKATTPAFNIVLRPLALTYGCHVIFTFADGSTKDVDLSNKNLKIKPNTVKNSGLPLDNY